MAAKSGNNFVTDKLSMAAELLNVIGEEEYVNDIPGFPSTGYLNKTDVSSIKEDGVRKTLGRFPEILQQA